ncbi:putative N-acetylmuramoyl-L-alanine amidase AmiB [Nitrospira sp. KM1]|uniref:N-acetylmuramoyl-L-alanine amidase family protein n=1 Tax=Nitrospira sp. KM1 TaxID=1936990 RepID=UPI0013A737D5|nr:N-acetylmuramoyl-L-alanine amidase [Nitrospira sp. KM1]BCA54183.1 putative N-acetylmuramoyl-L-alanine amidase AmiB [Nitrospira sp. KM1]
MLMAISRIISFLTLICLFVVPDPSQAAGSNGQDQQGKMKRSKGSQVSIAPTTLGLTTIQNLRTAISPGSIRLVLDLDRRTKAPKMPKPQAEGVVIEILNATLAKSAQLKVANGTIEKPFVVTQSSERSVAISLPAGSFQTYRMISLSNPPRLVMDVVPSNQTIPAATQESGIPPVTFEPPMQPIPPKAKSFTTIVIDPGHGGKDPGAHGQKGTEEKDITLKVGLKLRDILSKQPGIRVLMTRERDIFIELEDRAKFANRHEADLFVSIHVNSHPQRSVKGIEIYHFGEAKDQRALEVAARENGTPLNNTGVGWEYLVADLLASKKIEASLELAWSTKEAMVTYLNGTYTLIDHGVKTAPFYVLRFTSMPSILAEIAYISNAHEEDLLRTNAFTTHVAESLHEGVRAYLAASKQTGR